MLSNNKIVILAAAAGLTVWLYYRSLRKSKSLIPVPVVVSSIDPHIVLEVTGIIQSLALQKRPSSELIARLRAILAPLSEECVSQIKSISDEVSFGISEWIFYHTLRTNKTIAWNPVTGIVDQTMTSDEKVLGEKLARNIRKAYWDSHVADLQAENYTCVIDRLSELDERINFFRPIQFRRPIFDDVLIRQQIATKTFDRSSLISCASVAVDAMADLESPAAHEDTVAWFETHLFHPSEAVAFSTEIVNVLAFIFAQLDVLDAELANYKSAQLNSVARREKERSIFESLISTGTIHIVGIEKVFSNSEKFSNCEIFSTFKQFFLNQLPTTLPVLLESLAPDSDAINFFRVKLSAVERLAAFCVAINSLGCNADEDFLLHVYDAYLLEESADTVPDLLAVVRVKFGIDASGVLPNCMTPTGQVRSLYTRRILTLLDKVIVPGPIEAIPSTSLGSSPWYLSVAVKKLNELVVELTDFMADHLQVYLPIYKSVLQK